MKQKKFTAEETLHKWAGKNDFEISAINVVGNDQFQVSGVKLTPVTVGRWKIYVQLPASAVITLKDGSVPRALKVSAPEEARADAELYIKGLVDRKEISGIGKERNPRASHKLVKNKKGQSVLKRDRSGGSGTY